ncbi:MAG: hypothetical protein AAF488_13130 [Planctomycetota bacterium]
MKSRVRRGLVVVIGIGALSCFAVLPFLPELREWIREWRMTPEELLQATPWEIEESEAPVDWYWLQIRELTKDLKLQVSTNSSSAVTFEIPCASSAGTIKLQGHRASPLIRTRDGRTLIFADYNTISNGCGLDAYDLRTGKKRWRVQLKGVGLVDHSKYRNRVRIRQDHSRYVTVFGDEMAGRYTEIVELQSGETVAHRMETPPRMIRRVVR